MSALHKLSYTFIRVGGIHYYRDFLFLYIIPCGTGKLDVPSARLWIEGRGERRLLPCFEKFIFIFYHGFYGGRG